MFVKSSKVKNMKNLNFDKRILFLSLSMFFFAAVTGIASIVFPVFFRSQNISNSMIGYLDNLKVLSGVLVLFVLPIITKKIGIINSGILTLLCYSIPFIFFPILKLSMLIAFYGIGLIVFRVLLESITNMITTDEKRGRVFSILILAVSFGAGTGPIIVKIFGVNNILSYWSAIILILISGLFFLTFKNQNLEVLEKKKIDFLKYLKKFPIIFVSRFISEFLVQTMFVFGVIYGIMNNYSPENAGLFITFFCISGYIFNYPIGYFIDKYKKYRSTLLSGLIILFSSILLLKFFIISKIISYLLFFIFGIGSSIISISSTAILNNICKKDEILMSNTALWISGCIGMLFSSFLTGISIQIFGADGFFVPILFLLFISICFSIKYSKKFKLI